MPRFITALAIGVLLYAIQAPAQQVGPNGSLLGGEKAGHQAELVLEPTQVTVYLLEKGKLHDTSGSKICVVILQAGKTVTVDLVDQQGKKLVGKLDAPVEAGAVAVVTGRDRHGDAISARFITK